MAAEMGTGNDLHAIRTGLIKNPEWKARHQVAPDIFSNRPPAIWCCKYFIECCVNGREKVLT